MTAPRAQAPQDSVDAPTDALSVVNEPESSFTRHVEAASADDDGAAVDAFLVRWSAKRGAL